MALSLLAPLPARAGPSIRLPRPAISPRHPYYMISTPTPPRHQSEPGGFPGENAEVFPLAGLWVALPAAVAYAAAYLVPVSSCTTEPLEATGAASGLPALVEQDGD
jgi:hypothetical protein